MTVDQLHNALTKIILDGNGKKDVLIDVTTLDENTDGFAYVNINRIKLDEVFIGDGDGDVEVDEDNNPKTEQIIVIEC